MAAVDAIAFVDHLAAPDPLYTVKISGCPACGGAHAAVLHRITGRFLYRCGKLELSGIVDGWTETRRNFETHRADRSGHTENSKTSAAPRTPTEGT